MPDIEMLVPAAADFERTLASVQPDQWTLPTPCDEWDVAELVRHVGGGNALTAAILRGASREEGIEVITSFELGDDPVATVRASALDQLAAYREPGAIDRVVHHPMGDLPAAQLLGFRLADLAAHGWDLARAIGADESLDPGVVQEVWNDIRPMAPMLGDLGIFGTGASLDLADPVTDDGVSLQHRLLDALGRRP